MSGSGPMVAKNPDELQLVAPQPLIDAKAAIQRAIPQLKPQQHTDLANSLVSKPYQSFLVDLKNTGVNAEVALGKLEAELRNALPDLFAKIQRERGSGNEPGAKTAATAGMTVLHKVHLAQEKQAVDTGKPAQNADQATANAAREAYQKVPENLRTPELWNDILGGLAAAGVSGNTIASMDYSMSQQMVVLQQMQMSRLRDLQDQLGKQLDDLQKAIKKRDDEERDAIMLRIASMVGIKLDSELNKDTKLGLEQVNITGRSDIETSLKSQLEVLWRINHGDLSAVPRIAS